MKTTNLRPNPIDLLPMIDSDYEMKYVYERIIAKFLQKQNDTITMLSDSQLVKLLNLGYEIEHRINLDNYDKDPSNHYYLISWASTEEE